MGISRQKWHKLDSIPTWHHELKWSGQEICRSLYGYLPVPTRHKHRGTFFKVLNINQTKPVWTTVTPDLIQPGLQPLEMDALDLKGMQFLSNLALLGHQVIEANKLLTIQKKKSKNNKFNMIRLKSFLGEMLHYAIFLSPGQACILKCEMCELAFLLTPLRWCCWWIPSWGRSSSASGSWSVGNHWHIADWKKVKVDYWLCDIFSNSLTQEKV